MDRGKSQLGIVTIHVFLPFLLGFGIYVLWRPTNLLFFHWANEMGYFPIVSYYRGLVSFAVPFLPNCFLDSFPAALFLYALTSWFQIVWAGCYGKEWIVWAAIALFVGVASEVGQYFQLLSGKYDHVDVLFYLAAWILALYIPKGRKEDVCETP
ncbi:MAG: hypothetical protein ACI9S8_000938 [Chlamydiales bacterium]|jgi:hypothetical protein